MDDSIYLHCLNLFPKFGPKRLSLISNHFPNYETAYKASAGELTEAGISADIAKIYKDFANQTDPDTETERLRNFNISLLTQADEKYPELLKESDLPPALLYLRGQLPAQNSLLLAVVGTRRITNYGRAVVSSLVAELIRSGLCLVSGMAYGVDAGVAREAIAQNKPTVAVLGSGLDDKSLYPKEHGLLADDILRTGGCLLSEYPPSTPAFKQNFIARNRIIAGLCVGTLIIECDLKSGSLITAQYALDMNRRLYAVPGQIFAQESRGPNNLIKMGATLVTEAADILTDLNVPAETHQVALPDNPAEAVILDILTKGTTQTDQVIKLSGLDPAVVTSTLTFLEIKGRVKNVGANQYIKVR